MSGVKRVYSASPFFDNENIECILNEIKHTLQSGILTDGPQVQQFERDFAKYIGTKYAVAVSSGTAALEILLRHYNIEGKEVIVPTNTFVATPTAVLFSGGKPVFADIKEETLCIDPKEIEVRINSKTVGVIIVHLAGLICPELEKIKTLCKDKNLFVIEDAAHAHGAMIDGKMAGNLCDGGAFSFYPTKIMTTGQGGMITTNDSDLAKAALSMRNHGLDSERIMQMFGDNWCMSEVTAVLGKYQLANLENFLKKRIEIANLYSVLLEKNDAVTLFKTPSNIRHSYYKYPLRLHGIDREKLSSALKQDFGIDTGSIYYPPCHLHPWYKKNLGTREGDFPVSEEVLKQVICLPIHPGITKDIALYVISSLNDCISKL